MRKKCFGLGGEGYLRLVHDLKTLCLLEGVLESFLVMLLYGFENC